jgi:hypothetical protein
MDERYLVDNYMRRRATYAVKVVAERQWLWLYFCQAGLSRSSKKKSRQ